MALVDATPQDIPAIMAIERDPAHAVYLGNFTAEEHAAKMVDEDYRYFAWRQAQPMTISVVREMDMKNLITLTLSAASTLTAVCLTIVVPAVHGLTWA